MKDKTKHVLDSDVKELWKENLGDEELDRVLQSVQELGQVEAPTGLKATLKSIPVDQKENWISSWLIRPLPVAIPAVALLLLFIFQPFSPERGVIQTESDNTAFIITIEEDFDIDDYEILDDELSFLEAVL